MQELGQSGGQVQRNVRQFHWYSFMGDNPANPRTKSERNPKWKLIQDADNLMTKGIEIAVKPVNKTVKINKVYRLS